MAVYKLRFCLEDDENIYRDIEVLSSQTFTSLHPVINKAFGQKGNQGSALFTCDENWRKKKAIDISKKTPLSKYFTHPHQKLIFERTHSLLGNYFIELISTDPDEKKDIKYPRCIKSTGLLPSQLTGTEEKFEDEFIMDPNEFEDEFDDFDEIDDTLGSYQ